MCWFCWGAFTYSYQLSMSLFVKITFASGYAAMSSAAKQIAGASVTACILRRCVSEERRWELILGIIYLTMAQELVKLMSSKGSSLAVELGI